MMIRRLFAVVLAVVLVGWVLAPSASAAEVPVSFWVHGGAHVSADGTTVQVSFTYRCPKKYGIRRGFAVVSMQALERLGGGNRAFGIDTNGEGIDLNCDGQWRHGTHTVTATEGTFVPGTAFLSSDLLACPRSELNCLEVTQKRSVEVAPA